jgi:predicted HTH transcriptional regulator
MPIDLRELARRQSEQIEWKENVADIDDVVATLCAFANDLQNLGGGYVICGAREEKDEHGFPRMVRSGLTANRLKEVEGTVLARCRDRVAPPIAPTVEELPSDDAERRLLVFVQPATRASHSFRRGAEGAKHYVRVSRSTMEARNGLLRELLGQDAIEPWDRRPCPGATEKDVDLIALRDVLQRMGAFSVDLGLEPYLSSEVALNAFIPPLYAREPLTGVLRPRNFAILLFGREPQRFIPGAVSFFSIYPGLDRSDPHAERHELAGTLLDQARRMQQLLSEQTSLAFDKTDSTSPNVSKYPTRALYEAMGNALAHRDYELVDPTRLTAFSDRIEVVSPGSLLRGVTLDALRNGQVGPRWRNQALAWFFQRLQLGQAEGQGIPTILRSMRDEGCPPPSFEADEVSVRCVLPAHPRHVFLRDLRAAEQALALGELTRAKDIVGRVLASEPFQTRALQLFAEIQLELRDREPVAAWIRRHLSRLDGQPSLVLLALAEALVGRGNVPPVHRELVRRLLDVVSARRLEEHELRRSAAALSRAGDHQSAVKLIDLHGLEHQVWSDKPALRLLRANAMLAIARKRHDAAKDPSSLLEALAGIERELRELTALASEPELLQQITDSVEIIDSLRKAAASSEGMP